MRFRIFLLMMVGALTGFGTLAQTTPQPFLLTYIPNIQFAPVYVAIERGYFADANVEVAVEYLNEPDVVDLVAAGQAPFGIVSAEQALLAVSQGRPIQYIYNWFQKYPIGVVVSADSGIASVADLKGVTVGIPGRFGATYSGLTALLAANGLTEQDIDLQEIGFNAPEIFCSGAVMAAVVYVNNEPLQINNLARQGQCGEITATTVFTFADDQQLVSNGLITSNANIADHPEEVAAFVVAYHAGLTDAINNPARAYLLSVAHVDNLPLPDALRSQLEEMADAQDVFLATLPDREAVALSRVTLHDDLHSLFDDTTLLQFDVLLASISLWDAEAVGLSDADQWQRMQELLTTLGVLTAPVVLTDVYTNMFVPTPAP